MPFGTSVVYPKNAARIVRQHGLDGKSFVIGEFVTHDATLQFGSLNHGGGPDATLMAGPGSALAGKSGHQPAESLNESVENNPERTGGCRLAMTAKGSGRTHLVSTLVRIHSDTLGMILPPKPLILLRTAYKV